MSVGRDGASDAAAFIQAGIPAVEFGPAGAGHHGPEEWVSVSSLARYRRSLGDFVARADALMRPASRPAARPLRRGPRALRTARLDGGLA